MTQKIKTLPIVVSMNPMLYTDMNGQKWAVSGQHWVEVPETLTLDRVGEYMIVEQRETPAQATNVRSYEVQGSKGNTYTVADNGGTWTCTCPGFGWRKLIRFIWSRFLMY